MLFFYLSSKRIVRLFCLQTKIAKKRFSSGGIIVQFVGVRKENDKNYMCIFIVNAKVVEIVNTFMGLEGNSARCQVRD